MKITIVFLMLISLLISLCACGGAPTSSPSEQPPFETATEKAELPPSLAYEGELPENLFGIFDEESYVNDYFGVSFKRDGNWTFYSQQELASLNVGAAEAVLRSRGYAYDMYARNELETLGFTVAIPAAQYGKDMTEAEYAQATEASSARDYAGADYDVVSGEVGTIEFCGAEHACFRLTVAASGMLFYTEQIFLQRGEFIGVVYVSAQSEEATASLLSCFSGT